MRDRTRRALLAHQPRELSLIGLRESAVMLLLYAHAGEDCVVFQLRTHDVAHHRGEVSLPGGARDPGDLTLEHTALRETHEEIGIAAEWIDILGRLDDTSTRSSNYRITPFVGAVREHEEAVASAFAPREVTELFYVPIAHLLTPEARIWRAVEADGTPTATPAFQYGEHVIWGATARIVTQFVDLLAETR